MVLQQCRSSLYADYLAVLIERTNLKGGKMYASLFHFIYFSDDIRVPTARGSQQYVTSYPAMYYNAVYTGYTVV